MGTKRILSYLVIPLFVVSCSGPQSGTGGSGGNGDNNMSSYSPKPLNFRLSLTDAPKANFKEVNVNIDHMELFLKKNDTEKRLMLAQDLGMVNLLSLRDGVLLPLADISMPNGLDITHIRLVLKENNNHAIKTDNSRCEMQTPSAQQSGVKIILKEPVHIEEGYSYSMVVDFDADKSVVARGNGSCLLKPVIKLLKVTRQLAVDDSNTEGNTDNGGQTGLEDNTNPEEPVTDGTDTNVDPTTPTNDQFFDIEGNVIPPDQLGFDIFDSSTYPDGITANDLWMYF